MIRCFLILFIVIISFKENTYSQNIILESNDISIEITRMDTSSYVESIVIKNTSDKTILISMMDGVNIHDIYHDKYIGIGLYSGVNPYTPNHVERYIGKLDLTAISANDSIVIKQKIKFNLSQNLRFEIDYMLYNEKINTNEIIKIDRSTYDKYVCFLRLYNITK